MIGLSERPLSILLVDDDPERDVLARRLERESARYRVQHELTLEAALAEFSKGRFDVVLCDFVLGRGKNARPLVDAVVANGGVTKVVVFSGVEQGEHKEELLEAGAFWYLAKPVVFRELVHTIKTIEAFQAERELGEVSTRLAEMSYQFHSSLRLDDVAQRAVEAALELGFRRARLYFLDEEHSNLVGYAARGMDEGTVEGIAIPLSGSALIDRIFKLREPSAWSFEESRQSAKEADLAWIKRVGLEEVPWLDCPLLVGDRRIGTLAMDCKGSAHPDLAPLQKKTAGILAGLVAQAVNNCRLYEAEALARASLNQILIDAPDAVITTSLDGTIDFASPSTESIFGVPASRLLRTKAAEIYLDSAGHPGSGMLIAAAIMADLRARRPVSNKRVHVVGPDGRPLALSLSASLLHGADGKEVGTLGFLKSLGHLERQFEEYRNLLEGFGYGTVVLSRDGSITHLNRKAERLLGRAASDLVGEPLGDLLRPKDASGLAKALRDSSLSSSQRILRAETRTSSRGLLPLELTVSPIHGGTRHSGFVVGLYDRREQERLIWAGRLAALGEMVGALAHEINNPLNNMLTAIKILKSGHQDCRADPDQEAALEEVKQGVRRIADLVRRLRRLSRPQPTRHAQIDLGRLIREFLDFSSRRLKAAQVDVKMFLPDGSIYVNGDPVQIEQILSSLVTNATESMSSSGSRHLVIQVGSVDAGRVQVAVEDSGPGIPESFRDDIFELFFTTKRKTGTGFGLSLSRAIARGHEGELWLEEPVLHATGARFVLELPVLEAEKGEIEKEGA